MNWQFTIIDRNSVEHIIDEPVGWDNCQIVIKRDPELHGIFFDYQGNDFQFNGTAGQLIKAEHDQYGVEGNMIMVIAQACEGQEPEELYRGRLLFSKYEYSCGDECSVKIPIETTSDVMELRNRWDQKVNLQAVYSFNEIHELNDYEKCPAEIVLPSKTIFLQDVAIKKTTSDESINNGFSQFDTGDPDVIAVSVGVLIELGLDNKSAEIGNFGFDPPIRLTCIPTTFDPPAFEIPEIAAPHDSQQLWDGAAYNVVSITNPWLAVTVPTDFLNKVINYQEETANYNVDLQNGKLDIKVEGEFEPLNDTVIYNIRFVILKKDKDGIFTLISQQPLYDQQLEVIGSGSDFLGDPITYHKVKFSHTYLDPNYVLNKGDEIYVFFYANMYTPIADVRDLKLSLRTRIDDTSYVKFTALSHTPPSVAKLFMINESFSRVAEAITDDKIRVYSDYFGRTDAQPYPSDVDGCGGLEAITKGIFIRRQETRIPDQPAIFAQSMKDLWDGINPIHHIGMGIEDDPSRPGFKLLRIERWNYFYIDDEIMVCDNVNKINRATQERDHYSTIKFGYEKWEAEEYNGLDEFLTKRIYRTTLSQIKNELPIISKMIASGYAWEITRRKGDQDSKDWRYDNETFIACLKRGRYQIYSADEQHGGAYINISPKPPTPFTTADTVEFVDSGAITGGPYNIMYVQENDTYWTIEIAIGTFPAGTYDADILINGNPMPATINVELGNVTDPLNIIDPDTLYNFRISPIRNAMRWMDKILASYRKYDPANKIVFTDGDGNCAASGKMESATCRLEDNSIKENDPISGSVFADPDYPQPKLKPEDVKYEYPMSLKDFKRILLNPYGRISFNNECENGTGWIDTITYRPEEGTAQFELTPKFIE